MNLRMDNTLLAVQRISLGAAISILAIGSVFGSLLYLACLGVSLIGD